MPQQASVSRRWRYRFPFECLVCSSRKHGHPCDPSADGCWPADRVQNSACERAQLAGVARELCVGESCELCLAHCAAGGKDWQGLICDLGIGVWDVAVAKSHKPKAKKASNVNHHHRRERRDTVACSIIGHTQSPKSLSGAQLEFQHMGTLAVQAFVVCRLSVVLLPIPYSLLLLAIGREDC